MTNFEPMLEQTIKTLNARIKELEEMLKPAVETNYRLTQQLEKSEKRNHEMCRLIGAIYQHTGSVPGGKELDSTHTTPPKTKTMATEQDPYTAKPCDPKAHKLAMEIHSVYLDKANKATKVEHLHQAWKERQEELDKHGIISTLAGFKFRTT